MIFTEDKTIQIDDLLDKMAASLQLDDTRYDRMKSSYQGLKSWIESDELFFKPYNYDLYPHGSVRILTTVKPLGKDEFDLDVALHLSYGIPHTPDRVYKELKRRLNEHDKYSQLLELKNRCIRLNYSGDYHMDILPGIQEFSSDEHCLKIPDRDLGHWVSSNPRGYANWFLSKANLASTSILEKALRAENLPNDNFKYKKPLQRAVQLIKRYRDIYFSENGDYKTSSIILTTIAGNYYNGEDSIFKTVENIVDSIEKVTKESTSRIKILNPVNNNEDFTDKWESEPEYYNSFKAFAKHLRDEWQKLKADNGILEESSILTKLFGSDIFVKAQIEQANQIESYRKNKNLNVASSLGTLSVANSGSETNVKPNTFFGN
jgi:hypothetical protein